MISPYLLHTSLRRIFFGPGILLFLLTPFAHADYQLMWSDEFNQPDGSAPNPEYWSYDIGGWGWGNGESQYYTDRRENSRIENGELVIEVHKDVENEFPGNGYTSARLLTQGKIDWAYGRFEARVKVPDGASGLWPAFWMLGSNFSTVGWPQCGEIDIMEYVSRNPNEIFGTIHGPGYAGGAAFGNVYDTGKPVAGEYHTFAVEWEPGGIRWFFNDLLYHVATPSDVAPNDWVFDHNFFILLNVAVGGNFGGFIDPSIEFPTSMRVDYVRVYQGEVEPASITVPGIVEAEDFTTQTGVRFETTSDIGGGLNAGFLADGDSLDYLLNVQTSGRYAMDLRVASDAPVNGRAILSADSQTVTSDLIPNTGGWQAWTTLTIGEITLPKGLVPLKVIIETPSPNQDAYNLNWIEFRLLESLEDFGMFNTFEVNNGWTNTSQFLGWVNLDLYPWVYLQSFQSYGYAVPSDKPEGWLYLPK
jgi:beta-glucanase (GH16 family)